MVKTVRESSIPLKKDGSKKYETYFDIPG